jgi:hypothetical protein
VLSATEYTYNGKAKKPAVTLKASAKTVIDSANYTVTYSNNTSIGIATVTIEGKGDFKGTVTRTFKILPANITGLAVKATTDDTVELSWNKVSGAAGYVIYQFDECQKKYVRVATSSGTSRRITGLSSGGTYKFAVKAYKKVSGTYYLSKSSPVVTASSLSGNE